MQKNIIFLLASLVLASITYYQIQGPHQECEFD